MPESEESARGQFISLALLQLPSCRGAMVAVRFIMIWIIKAWEKQQRAAPSSRIHPSHYRLYDMQYPKVLVEQSTLLAL